MPANRLSLRLMRDAHEKIIELQPHHIQHWVAIGGDGMTSDLSYCFSYSYLGALAPTGKEVFSTYFTPSGDVSWKNFTLMTTFFNNRDDPSRNEQIILYDLAGNSLGRFKIVFVMPFFVGSTNSTNRAKFKVDIHVERIES